MSNKNIKNKDRKEQKKEKLKVSSIDLHEKRIIYLDGDIDDKVARETVELLLKMDMVNNKDITMYINSPGAKGDEVTLVITSEQETDLIFDGTTNAKLNVIKLD